MSYLVPLKTTKTVLAYAAAVLAKSPVAGEATKSLDAYYQSADAVEKLEVVFFYDEMPAMIDVLMAEMDSLQKSMKRLLRVVGADLIGEALDYNECALKMQSCACMLAVISRGIGQFGRGDIIFTTEEIQNGNSNSL